MQKHRKWTSRLPLSTGCFLIAQAGFFLLRYNNSSKIPCTKPWFFPLKFPKISFLMKVLKIGIFGRFLTEWKMHYLAIFFTKWHFNWDALLTCQRWTCFLQPPFFPRALKMVKFHFLAVFSKKKSFGDFDCDFRKCFTKGFFLTENEVFRNFRF